MLKLQILQFSIKKVFFKNKIIFVHDLLFHSCEYFSKTHLEKMVNLELMLLKTLSVFALVLIQRVTDYIETSYINLWPAKIQSEFETI